MNMKLTNIKNIDSIKRGIKLLNMRNNEIVIVEDINDNTIKIEGRDKYNSLSTLKRWYKIIVSIEEETTESETTESNTTESETTESETTESNTTESETTESNTTEDRGQSQRLQSQRTESFNSIKILNYRIFKTSKYMNL